ncbi:hypothetical protein ACFOEK_20675 [Litoribrevibacter euphylliae]|uniref:Uncharacterized protein n=1 Tax=Litoribrevibacter euphylliae TaxID=1834034 RepID=A0ABV7HHW8_9GAMM
MKIILLLAVMAYFANTSKATNSAIVWGIGSFIIGLMSSGIGGYLFISAFFSLLVAFAVFKVVEYLDGKGSYYWLAYASSIPVLIFFG